VKYVSIEEEKLWDMLYRRLCTLEKYEIAFSKGS
jgi:hypothetical protein